MYKLLLGLGILDLTFHFPHLTALTLVGAFLFNNLTEHDKQQIMSIYSNAKEFTKYLSNKAKELGLSLKELRKQMVTDLEIPESCGDCCEEEEVASPNFFENLPDLSEYLSYEELEEFSTNVPLIEKVAAVVKEGLHQPELVWHGDNLTLNDYIGDDPDIVDSRKDIYENYLGLKLDYTKPMTAKYFRQISSKFKAVGKNNLNEVIDSEKHELALNSLHELDYFFRHGTLKPFIFD